MLKCSPELMCTICVLYSQHLPSITSEKKTIIVRTKIALGKLTLQWDPLQLFCLRVLFWVFFVALIIKYLLYNTGRKIKLGNVSVWVAHAILNLLPYFTMKALITRPWNIYATNPLPHWRKITHHKQARQSSYHVFKTYAFLKILD